MKTVHTVTVGALRLVLRNDGGIYIGEAEDGIMGGRGRNSIRVGSSAAICLALSEAFREMGEFIRSQKGEHG